MWLRVRMLNSLVLSFKTMVRATRDSLREADQTFCAKVWINSPVSERGISRSKVSSAEIDLVGLSGITEVMIDAPGKLVQAMPIPSEPCLEHRRV